MRSGHEQLAIERWQDPFLASIGEMSDYDSTTKIDTVSLASEGSSPGEGYTLQNYFVTFADPKGRSRRRSLGDFEQHRRSSAAVTGSFHQNAMRSVDGGSIDRVLAHAPRRIRVRRVPHRPLALRAVQLLFVDHRIALSDDRLTIATALTPRQNPPSDPTLRRLVGNDNEIAPDQGSAVRAQPSPAAPLDGVTAEPYGVGHPYSYPHQGRNDIPILFPLHPTR